MSISGKYNTEERNIMRRIHSYMSQLNELRDRAERIDMQRYHIQELIAAKKMKMDYCKFLLKGKYGKRKVYSRKLKRHIFTE